VNKTISIFGGNSNPKLVEDVAHYVGVPVGQSRVERFSDGEIFVEVGENVRNVNCFIVQSTCSPPNDNIMELLIMIDALKRASAGSIVALIRCIVTVLTGENTNAEATALAAPRPSPWTAREAA